MLKQQKIVFQIARQNLWCGKTLCPERLPDSNERVNRRVGCVRDFAVGFAVPDRRPGRGSALIHQHQITAFLIGYQLINARRRITDKRPALCACQSGFAKKPA